MRLRPRGSSDAFDLVLRGMEAIVESIAVSPAGRIRVAVLVNDDPGRDPGEEGQPGHRFVYDPGELELLPPAQARA